MSGCLQEPRTDKTNLPVTESVEVPVHKRAKFVGPGGINLRRLTAEFGVQISSREDGKWAVFAPNSEALEEAKEAITALLEDSNVPEFEFGAVLTVKVIEIKERGIAVEMHPGLDPVFIPLSQLSASKVRSLLKRIKLT